ncbi:nucleoside-diphosphate-sugar epimerase [Roseinatronobacter thiooxidans]|uniref:Nucleoside-diphosphate-sugar epimerase n=1 Tax=Roseinatronobacter thiooxidans TaxID=121821 RepID=A0A2W7QEU6_9RHOB|nr:NAD(P)-dependent oxidoreductase [Roseinatronobacter thiooxidans]PZX45926.1 nucleoside-diphosphate-sugar epimerase [Roseinatronobacter thiooxidans]
MRILFTGGSGKAGRHAVAHLLARGHRVLNVDLVPLALDGVDNRIADITDAGQMFDVMSSYAGFDELDAGTGVPRFDAVVHFAAVPRILLKSDNECFRVNTLGTYNVIDAALKFGVRKVIFASSETTYGVCFADGMRQPDYLPLDEGHPTVPEDSYAMSKVVNEATAQCFQRRSGADIYGLRINNVMEPEDYAAQFPAFLKDPSLRRRNFFAYIDARDLGHMVDRCLHVDGLGFQVFNAANDTHSVDKTTAQLIAAFYPDVPITREMGTQETFYSNTKAKAMLGFTPQYDWRTILGI